jgi:hypothetical protein
MAILYQQNSFTYLGTELVAYLKGQLAFFITAAPEYQDILQGNLASQNNITINIVAQKGASFGIDSKLYLTANVLKITESISNEDKIKEFVESVIFELCNASFMGKFKALDESLRTDSACTLAKYGEDRAKAEAETSWIFSQIINKGSEKGYLPSLFGKNHMDAAKTVLKDAYLENIANTRHNSGASQNSELYLLSKHLYMYDGAITMMFYSISSFNKLLRIKNISNKRVIKMGTLINNLTSAKIPREHRDQNVALYNALMNWCNTIVTNPASSAQLKIMLTKEDGTTELTSLEGYILPLEIQGLIKSQHAHVTGEAVTQELTKLDAHKISTLFQ